MDRFMHINLDMEIGALFIIIFVWMDFTTDRTRETLKTGLSQKKKKKKKTVRRNTKIAYFRHSAHHKSTPINHLHRKTSQTNTSDRVPCYLS